jgi:hypothetical protein
MTKEDFLDEMKWFLEFYEKTLNDTQTKIWFDFFGNFKKDKFHQALVKYIEESKQPFFPAIGEINDLSKQLNQPIPLSHRPFPL